MRIFLLLVAIVFTAPAAEALDWQEIEITREGQPVKLSDFKGKNVLVMFWATWCPYCKQQIPAYSLLKNLYASSENLEIIAISTDHEGEEVAKNYLLSNNINNLPVFSDNRSQLLHSLGFYAIPSLVLISKEGKIIGSYRGLQNFDLGYLEKVIKQ